MNLSSSNWVVKAAQGAAGSAPPVWVRSGVCAFKSISVRILLLCHGCAKSSSVIVELSFLRAFTSSHRYIFHTTHTPH